jgi:replication factor C subunit 3/5
VDKVVAAEDVSIAPEAVDALVKLSKGDMRRALNVLQACHASTMPMPEVGNASKRQVALPRDQREVITSTTIHECIASPLPSDIALVRDTLLGTSDVASILTTLQTLKNQKGLALADLLTALGEELAELEVPAATRVEWLKGLAEVEYRLAGGGSETVQMGGLVGVVRQGVELMDKR